MLKIAITGSLASGKSVVEAYLKEKGFKVYDTDEIAHKILENSDEVKTAFSGFDITTDGRIDRKKLGKLVFADKNLLKKLEQVIHPKVKEELNIIFNNAEENIFVSVPQLYEAGFEGLFDKVILVTADENTRLERLMKRNNLTREEAVLRIKSQIHQEEKIAKADYIIENNTSKEYVLNELNILIEKL